MFADFMGQQSYTKIKSTKNCSLIRIICYNVQRFKGVASGKQFYSANIVQRTTKCFQRPAIPIGLRNFTGFFWALTWQAMACMYTMHRYIGQNGDIDVTLQALIKYARNNFSIKQVSKEQLDNRHPEIGINVNFLKIIIT